MMIRILLSALLLLFSISADAFTILSGSNVIVPPPINTSTGSLIRFQGGFIRLQSNTLIRGPL